MPMSPGRTQAAASLGNRGAEPEQRDAAQRLRALAVIRRYGRGQEIYAQDSSADQWFRVVTGLVHKCVARPDGRRQIVELLLPGDFFGFTAREHHLFAAEAALEDTAIECYSRLRVEQLANTDPGVARELRMHAFEVISRLREQIVILGRITATEKVGAFLVSMADRTVNRVADQLELQISRYDIADYLALSAETVSRSFTGLRHCGAITLPSSRSVRILTRDNLDDLASAPMVARRPVE